MLCRLSVRWLRPRPALQVRVLDPLLSRAPAGGAKSSALPVWAVASVSAVGPSGAGGWYEALATSAPVQGAEDVLLFAHTASGPAPPKTPIQARDAGSTSQAPWHPHFQGTAIPRHACLVSVA